MAIDVLVLDDDLDLRATLVDLLTDEGFEVRDLGEASELVAALVQHRPRVLLLDLTMPGFDPERDLPPVRERGLLADTLVLALSGLHDTEARARALGLDGAVRKPFELDELIGRLARVCRPAGTTTAPAHQ